MVSDFYFIMFCLMYVYYSIKLFSTMLIIDFLIKRAQHSVLKDNNDRKPFRLMPFVANHVTCDEQRELGLANIYVMVN